jgi:hypothetical protein
MRDEHARAHPTNSAIFDDHAILGLINTASTRTRPTALTGRLAPTNIGRRAGPPTQARTTTTTATALPCRPRLSRPPPRASLQDEHSTTGAPDWAGGQAQLRSLRVPAPREHADKNFPRAICRFRLASHTSVASARSTCPPPYSPVRRFTSKIQCANKPAPLTREAPSWNGRGVLVDRDGDRGAGYALP